MSVWKELVKEKIGQWKSKGKTKIFCIGRNKTGTTSIKKALEQNGFVVGNQRKASLLVDDYLKGHSDTIIEYCNSAEAFQDVPFSYPGTYESLDRSFPGSKFILSVRESSEIWYESFVRFHSKRFGMGSIPTKDTLLNSQYIYKGWIWKSYVSQFGCDHKLYDKEVLMTSYQKYNDGVISYFSDQPEKLLVIDISKKGSYFKFCDFLNIQSTLTDFPWEKRTSEL